MRRCGTPLAKQLPSSPRSNKPFDLDARCHDDDLECSVCLALPTDPVLTVCGHLFCDRCLKRVMRRGYRICPMCRGPLPFMAPAKRCGALLIARLARLKGLERFALKPAFHPCLEVHALAVKVSACVVDLGRLGDDMRAHAPLAEIRRRSTSVIDDLEAARLRLGVAILAHPNCTPPIFYHATSFI